MIRWHRSFGYFLNQAGDVYERMDEFMERYNCSIDEYNRVYFTCSEENFLLIKLTCPEVIINPEDKRDRMA